jgi:hypothetical protein
MDGVAVFPRSTLMADKRFPIAVSLITVACSLPLAAGAQTPSYATSGETIHGTIASVASLTHILVADDRGFTDDVTLRRGAEVSANGVRLEPGERVTITGSAAGRTFLATRIMTHGQSYANDTYAPQPTAYGVPVPAYYPAPIYYPAPVYYGPSIWFGFGSYYRYGRGFRPYHGYYGRGYRGVGIGVRIR